MLALNDTVHYGMDGVCQVVDIVVKKIDGQERRFYELHPVFRKNTVVFLPVDNEKLLSRVRPVLSSTQIMSAVENIKQSDCIWIEQESARKEAFQQILRSGDHKQLVCLVRTLYEHRLAMQDEGRKMRITDSTCLKEAERLLFEEFAYVLEIAPHEVPAFIEQHAK